jgi:hypothetical protein
MNLQNENAIIMLGFWVLVPRLLLMVDDRSCWVLVPMVLATPGTCWLARQILYCMLGTRHQDSVRGKHDLKESDTSSLAIRPSPSIIVVSTNKHQHGLTKILSILSSSSSCTSVAHMVLVYNSYVLSSDGGVKR